MRIRVNKKIINIKQEAVYSIYEYAKYTKTKYCK
jgi:hypothetical protein